MNKATPLNELHLQMTAIIVILKTCKIWKVGYQIIFIILHH